MHKFITNTIKVMTIKLKYLLLVYLGISCVLCGPDDYNCQVDDGLDTKLRIGPLGGPNDKCKSG